ncbi:MAG: prepilin-type N-terminal cleavage/methylation domain-containing protein [Opitutaceae bacterium]|jgi:prepilin-type N-terminal cleavage/methylation domain-containing protein/prepilin-type processing-associated H-X9-DG protein|nr:prepilin-type N-terminal cleavage/methylation domain-containing protein [Opitutaceae bacterium]
MNPQGICPRNHRRGFTLIELLTVIAIIGILAGILIPVIGRVRASARQVQGVANLRQIGNAIELFANDNKNRFPPAVAQSNNYSIILKPYVGLRGSTFADGESRSEIFKDPSATLPGGQFHFSANPNFMGDLQQWNGTGPRPSDFTRLVPRTVANRASQQVLLADGCQGANGNPQTHLYSVAGIYNRLGANSDNPVARGPDIDLPSSGGHIRWRASGGSSTKCLWADGHVSIMRQGELRLRHFQID